MIHKVEAKNLIDTKKIYLSYEEENTCPICKSKLSPKYLSSVLFQKDDNKKASVINFCNGCNSVFITSYALNFDRGDINTQYYSSTYKILSEPSRYVPQEFDKEINNLSPQFVKIYNQALAAESYNLDEIAGLGYRKSLEFLIKDFAISEHPDDEEKIKSLMLGPCIKHYIDDSRIKTLAEKSAWIGNDEAHYIRKQDDRDITDMKAFIKAAVYFISMVLITKDAETIKPK